MPTHTRLATIGAATALALGLAACGGNDDDSGRADEGITPIVTLPFLEVSPRIGANTMDVTCPSGGNVDIATPADGSRVVTTDSSYESEQITVGQTKSILVPTTETSVIQVTPDSKDCTVSVQAGAAASLGDYTVSERTVFAISLPRD